MFIYSRTSVSIDERISIAKIVSPRMNYSFGKVDLGFGLLPVKNAVYA